MVDIAYQIAKGGPGHTSPVPASLHFSLTVDMDAYSISRLQILLYNHH